MPKQRKRGDYEHLDLTGAVSSAISHGARFIVADDDSISVGKPEMIPVPAQQILRRRWTEAKAEILRREHEIRDAEPVLCPHCGTEVGRFIGNNLWVCGSTYQYGWGSDNWRNMGQAIKARLCPSCGERHVIHYRYRPNWGIAHWDNNE